MKIAVSIGLDIFIVADFIVAKLIFKNITYLGCVGLYFFDGISKATMFFSLF